MKKVIIKSHSIPAASAVAAYEQKLELGNEVTKVLGYYVQVLKTGGLTPEQCTVSYSNGAKTIFEPVGLGHLIVSSAVAIKDRFFMEEPFDVPGYLITRMNIPAIPGTEFLVQHILLVEATK